MSRLPRHIGYRLQSRPAPILSASRGTRAKDLLPSRCLNRSSPASSPAADCTAFAYPAIQRDFLKGRVALVGCPKLDATGPFVDKLAEILRANEIRDITVLHMTVPCCAQLDSLVAEAMKRSGSDVPCRSFVVGIEGTLTSD